MTRQNLYNIVMLVAVGGLFTAVLVASFALPSHARSSFGEDCYSCHKAGIAVLSNATETVQVEVNTLFLLEISASGGESGHMEVVWSNVSHNAFFTFKPKEVEDNRVHDANSEGGKITALFEITAPAVEGTYALRMYAASSNGRGGFADVDVTVGAGGEVPEIPKSALEIIMEWIMGPLPYVLGGAAVLGMVLYVFSWSRLSGGLV